MSVTRYREGGVTVTLDGGLEDFVRQALVAALGGTLAAMESKAEAIAADARAAWYGDGGVEKETGLGGDIVAVTTVDVTRGEVRVSIGSTDTRVDPKTRKPVPIWQHRPGPTSKVLAEVSKVEYQATPKKHRKYVVRTGKHYAWKANPRASDGKKLIDLFVKAPARASIRTIATAMSAEIARRGRTA